LSGTNHPMKRQLRVIFSGRVQGVGFRYTARSVAHRWGVTGWVRNDPGGEVEILAEAEEGVLEDFVAEIEAQFKGYIRDRQLEWGPASGSFGDFGIRM